MDDLTEEVLRIVMEARDDASATLAEFGNHLDGAAGHVSALRTAMGAVGLASAAFLADAVKQAADFQGALATVQNNTTMTNGDVDTMRTAILKLASESNAPISQLTDGFMHISNLGFNAKQSVQILTAAMESATSTGGDTGKVANVLATQLHEFGLHASDAGRAMDVLHLSAALGNVTLEQFVESTSKATATAANLHVPLVDVDAALSALSRHMNISQASTAFAGMLTKIINPSASAKKELLSLQEQLERSGKAAGVDLVYDFSAAGLKSQGLTKIMQDLMLATGGNATEIMKLIPATRGGLAAMVELGTGMNDTKSITAQLSAAWAGTLTPTQEAFARSQQTLTFQLGQLQNRFQVVAITIGSQLLPMLSGLLARIMPVVGAVESWVLAHPKLTAAILGTVAVVGTLVGGMALLGTAFAGAGVILGPLVAAIAALAGPLVLVGAAVAALYEAWQHDWGGIREKTQAAWQAIQPALHDLQHAVDLVAQAYRSGGLQAAVNTAWTQVQQLWGQLAGWLGSTGVPALAKQLDVAETALWNWIKAATPPALRALGDLVGELTRWMATTGVPRLAAQLNLWETAFWNWLKPAARAALTQLGDYVGELARWMATTGVPLLAKQLNVWETQFWNWLKPAARAALTQLGDYVGELARWMATSGVPLLAKQLDAWETQFWNWLKVVTPKVLAAAGDLVGELARWMATSGVPMLARQLNVWETAFWHWIPRAAGAALTALGNYMGQLGTYIDHQADTAIRNAAMSLGQALVNGMIHGVESLGGSLLGAIKQHLVTSPLDSIKGLLGIHSPSTVYAELGKHMVEGVVAGVGDRAGETAAALGRAIQPAQVQIGTQLSGIVTAIKAFRGQFQDAGKTLGTALAAGLITAAVAATPVAAAPAAHGQQAVSPATVYLQKYNDVINKGNELTALAAAHQQRLQAITSQGYTTYAQYAAIQKQTAQENLGYATQRKQLEAQLAAQHAAAAQQAKNERAQAAAQAKAARAAAHEQDLAQIAQSKAANAASFAAAIAGLHGVDAARAQETLHALQYEAELAAARAKDANNAIALARDLGRIDGQRYTQQLADARALTSAEQARTAQARAEHAQAAAAAKAARAAAHQQELNDIAQAAAAKARAYQQELAALGAQAIQAGAAHLRALQYAAAEDAIKARYAGDERARVAALAQLAAQYDARTLQLRLQQEDQVRAARAKAHAEHLAQIRATQALRATAHAAHMAEIAQSRAATKAAHAEHLAEIAQARAATNAAHAEHLAQLAQARAAAKAAHAEHLQQVAQQREAAKAAHTEQMQAIQQERQARAQQHAEAMAQAAQARAAAQQARAERAAQLAALHQQQLQYHAQQVEQTTAYHVQQLQQAQQRQDLNNTYHAQQLQQMQQVADLRNTYHAQHQQQLQQIASLTAQYHSQHMAYIQAEAAARKAKNTAELAQIQQLDAAMTQRYQDELAQLKAVMAQTTAQYQDQVAGIGQAKQADAVAHQAQLQNIASEINARAIQHQQAMGQIADQINALQQARAAVGTAAGSSAGAGGAGVTVAGPGSAPSTINSAQVSATVQGQLANPQGWMAYVVQQFGTGMAAQIAGMVAEGKTDWTADWVQAWQGMQPPGSTAIYNPPAVPTPPPGWPGSSVAPSPSAGMSAAAPAATAPPASAGVAVAPITAGQLAAMAGGGSTPASVPFTATSAQPQAITINVTVQNGAVQIEGGPANDQTLARDAANAVSQALKQLIQSQKNSAPGKASTAPGNT